MIFPNQNHPIAKALCILRRIIDWTVDASAMRGSAVAMRDCNIRKLHGIGIHRLCHQKCDYAAPFTTMVADTTPWIKAQGTVLTAAHRTRRLYFYLESRFAMA